MFGVNHLIWLGISFALIGVLLFCSLKFKFSIKICAIIMSGISILSEFVKIFAHMLLSDPEDPSRGMVLKVTSLPLHLCSIIIFLIFYIALSKNEERKQKVLNFYVPIALIGGILALLLATSGTEFTRPQPYQSFIYHAAIVWFALHALITKKVDMGLRTYITNIVILAAMTFAMIWINGALQNFETNFFFVVRPPAKGLPLLNLNHGWYVYFVNLIAVGLVLLTALHLPYMIIEAKKKKALKK